MGSQVDINTGTHAKEGMGLELGLLEQNTQCHPYLHAAMQMGWS